MNFRTVSREAQALVVSEMRENAGHVPRMRFDSGDGQRIDIAEMIGTDDGAREFLETVTYQAYEGREQVPLLYKPLYAYRENANFPKTMSEESFGPVQVVFLKKLEGGEIKFGTIGKGEQKVVSFDTWATGLEYDEDIVEYNEYWRLDDIGLAFGEAYNHMLNHLHLGPIVSHSDTSGAAIQAQYQTATGGLENQYDAQKDGTPQLIEFDTDLRTTLENALRVLPKGSIILHQPFEQLSIQQALAADYDSQNRPGLVAEKLSMTNAIAYEGAEITVGDKVYIYDGVEKGYLYLASPAKKNFTEFVKHDLRIDNGDGDLSRLVLDQVVGRARRAVLAAVGGADGIVKVETVAH